MFTAIPSQDVSSENDWTTPVVAVGVIVVVLVSASPGMILYCIVKRYYLVLALISFIAPIFSSLCYMYLQSFLNVTQ